MHNFPWSIERFEGVSEEYTKAGCTAGLITVVGGDIEITHEQILSLSGFNIELVKRILAVNGTKGSAEEAFKAFMRFKETFSPEQLDPEEIREVRKNLSIVKDLADRNPSIELFNRICHNVFTQEIGTFVSMKARAPLFKRALANRGVTAWICATDGIALSALSYLRARGISVPRELSIAGFDNTPVKALEQRLTSLDFNASGFVHQMLNFISRPPKPRGKHRHSTIEVEGVIMLRDTTGPAPKRRGSMQ
jgi:hypothetical protein